MSEVASFPLAPAGMSLLQHEVRHRHRVPPGQGRSQCADHLAGGDCMMVYFLVFKYNSREAGQVEQVRRIERESPNMHGDRLDTGLDLDA